MLNDANYILGGSLDSRISPGALLEILVAICNIATAVVFFPVLKRVNESVALGYVASRTVESAMIVAGLISLMSVVTLRNDLGGSPDPASLSIAGHALVAFHDWTFLLGPQFCSGLGNGLLLGFLMQKSELVPRRMAMLGLIGGPLAFIGGVLALFGTIQDPSVHCSPLQPSRLCGRPRWRSTSEDRREAADAARTLSQDPSGDHVAMIR